MLPRNAKRIQCFTTMLFRIHCCLIAYMVEGLAMNEIINNYHFKYNYKYKLSSLSATGSWQSCWLPATFWCSHVQRGKWHKRLVDHFNSIAVIAISGWLGASGTPEVACCLQLPLHVWAITTASCSYALFSRVGKSTFDFHICYVCIFVSTHFSFLAISLGLLSNNSCISYFLFLPSGHYHAAFLNLKYFTFLNLAYLHSWRTICHDQN